MRVEDTWGKEGAVDRIYLCEDCGARFEEVELDIEDEPLVCPECGGLDLQLIGEQITEEH